MENAIESMAATGGGDAGALTHGLRHGITSLGLRALAAKALHTAASAPERMADIFDNAAAGWLYRPVFPPAQRAEEPLPISPAFWRAFWELVKLPPAARDPVFAGRVLGLAGELDPRINARMAAVATEYRGVADAAAGDPPRPFDLEALAACPPASLGYALRQELQRADGVAPPVGRNLTPLLRHMPTPLNYINVAVIETLPAMGLVAGYRSAWPDQLALCAFLMGQAAHHYSALYIAVTLAVVSLERPDTLELMLDSIFKGWVHGRDTPLLIGVDWTEHRDLRVDQVRDRLAVTPFDSPYAAAMRSLSREP